MDSGATHLLTFDLNSLSNLVSFTDVEHVIVGKWYVSPYNTHGYHIFLSSSNPPIILSQVFHTLSISQKLISISKLCHDNRVIAEFYPSYFLVKDLHTKQVLLRGRP